MANDDRMGLKRRGQSPGRKRERGRERASIQEVKPQGQSQEKAETLLGVGRGGRPRGGGLGNCYGGKGKGRRFYN